MQNAAFCKFADHLHDLNKREEWSWVFAKVKQNADHLGKNIVKYAVYDAVFSYLGHVRALRQVGESEIAFFAKISQNVDHLGKGQVIVFDEVVTDTDSTYSLGKIHWCFLIRFILKLIL